MSEKARSLVTRRGEIPFPAYFPVTTFGDKYPLDKLIRPYLPRLARAVMVSFHYARQMKEPPRIPLLVDSGGFASLFEGATVQRSGDLGILEIKREEETETLHPGDVLDFQERVADVAFTLDFPIPPGMNELEAHRRQELTIANALWAIENRRRRDLPLYACIQGWDEASVRKCAKAYAGKGFDGIALGGMVPRQSDKPLVLAIVRAAREEIGTLPLHVFGLGNPEMVADLYTVGVDSVDSTSYVKLAADGRLWGNPDFRMHDPSPTERMHLALCNLAVACGKTIPLSVSLPIFGTLGIMQVEEPVVEYDVCASSS